MGSNNNHRRDGSSDGILPSLGEARQLNPPVADPAEALRYDLRMAFLEGVTSDDMEKLAGKLKQMALSGDMRAMRLITALLVEPTPSTNVVVVNREEGRSRRRRKVVVQAAATSSETLRDDCADLIRLEGPLTSAVLADRCGVTVHVIDVALAEGDWFEMGEARRWHLSGKGFAAINADRETS